MFYRLRRLDARVLRLRRNGWAGVVEALVKGYAAHMVAFLVFLLLVWLGLGLRASH